VTEYLQSQFLVQEALRKPNWNQAVADTGSSQGNAYADPADGSTGEGET
jgi:hypothetical protein